MINPKDLFDELILNDISCFCGVPDSLLKYFCAYIQDNTSNQNHTITANEGNAIALAAGHYLATGKPACVYMQNSGLGNCVNPLLSLTDSEVYNIPVLMFIGYRGEPGIKDEPQHIKQGIKTLPLLETLDIKYSLLPEDFSEAKVLLDKAFCYMKETNKSYAFVVRKNTFYEYKSKKNSDNNYQLTRENALDIIINKLNFSDVLVSSTGYLSRELYELREKYNQNHKQDFLTVGSMGHTSSIALGIALQKPGRRVFCIEGDGSFLMHQGSIGVNSSKHLKNFRHIVINNRVHESVGAQPTAINVENISQIAKNCSYDNIYSVKTQEELESILPEFINSEGTNFIEIQVKCETRKDLGRPKEKPQENKNYFMDNLNQIDFIYNGAIENLSKIIKKEKAKKLLIFTGKNSFESIKTVFEKEIKDCEINYYNDFSTNPKKDELDKAIKEISNDFDIIVAIGGGSVLDFGKAYKYYTNCIQKILAIPTTSGTGSESTQFAVMYINGEKKSLESKKILPDYAICDSKFSLLCPKYLKACTALDAFCQGIESYFSVNSNPLSRLYAKKAIELCSQNIIDYVNTTNLKSAQKMMLGAHFSGKAINISKTTASHAISYKITTEYNIPHGHAVALTMAKVLEFNKNVNVSNCNDKRGVDFVKEKINEIYEILGIEDANEYFKKLFEDIGINEFRPTHINSELIANSVNEERLANNPVIMNKKDIKNILSIWEN